MLFFKRPVAEMGFCVRFGKLESSLHLDHPYVCMENENAEFAWSFCLGMVGHRIVRMLWLLRGWPVCFAAAGVDDRDVQGRVLDRLKSDFDLFGKLKEQADCDLAAAMVDRSCFQTFAVRQLVACAALDQWQPSQRLSQLARDHNSGIVSSQVTEDGFHYLRHAEHQGTNRSMANARRYDSLLRSANLSTRHHYEAVPWESATPPSKAALPDTAYQGVRADASLPIAGIGTYKQKACYFSPGVAGLSLPVVDMLFCSYLEKRLAWNDMELVWLSGLLDVPHMLVRDKSDAIGTWYFVLQSAGGLGQVAWPAETVFAYDGGREGVRPMHSEAAGIRDVSVLFVLNESHWEARELEFKAPLWEWLHRGGGPVDQAGCAKLVCISGPVEPLIKVVARAAFGALDKAMLVKLSRHLDAGLSATLSIYDLVFGLVKNVLSCDDLQACDICSRRTWRCTASESVIDVAEAEELFDKQEREELKKVKQKVVSEKAVKTEYEKAHREKRTVVKAAQKERDAAAAGGCRGRGKAAAKAKAKAAAAAVVRMVLPATGELTQADVKAFLPPGSHVWRDSKGAWHQHTPPHPRTSARWLMYGERGAALQILRDCWRLHLQDSGQLVAECPVVGLFQGADVLGVGSGPAASSASSAGAAAAS